MSTEYQHYLIRKHEVCSCVNINRSVLLLSCNTGEAPVLKVKWDVDKSLNMFPKFCDQINLLKWYLIFFSISSLVFPDGMQFFKSRCRTWCCIPEGRLRPSEYVREAHQAVRQPSSSGHHQEPQVQKHGSWYVFTLPVLLNLYSELYFYIPSGLYIF